MGVAMDDFGGREIAAWVVATLGTVGAAVKYLLGRVDSSYARKHADLETEEKRLQAWRDSLDRREQGERLEREARLNKLEREVHHLRRDGLVTRGVLLEVTVELRAHAPESGILERAEAHLRQKWPDYDAPTGEVPDSMASLLARLDEGGKKA